MKTFKSLLFFLGFILSSQLLPAQYIELEVIVPFGDYMQGSNGMDLHGTLGEPVVERIANGEILTQGFHQVFDFVDPVYELPNATIELKVYPNPATDWLAIETDSDKPLTLRLADNNGRILYQTETTNPLETLDISV